MEGGYIGRGSRVLGRSYGERILGKMGFKLG